MDLKLVRVDTGPQGTFGTLILNHIPFVVTLEDPWKDNQQFISCIPTGYYLCVRVKSPKFGDTFEVINVPNRTHILFHGGNLIDNTEGCILVAESFENIKGKVGIVNPIPGKGFSEFMDKMKNIDQFGLTIIGLW